MWSIAEGSQSSHVGKDSISDVGMEEPLSFTGEWRKFAIESIRRAFREESGEFTVYVFIGQIIRDEENAGVRILDCKRFEIIPVEG